MLFGSYCFYYFILSRVIRVKNDDDDDDDNDDNDSMIYVVLRNYCSVGGLQPVQCPLCCATPGASTFRDVGWTSGLVPGVNASS